MKSSQAAKAPQPLRIIGGRWRGRKLNFPEVAGLRPTGDRIRETLFNWLAPSISGARCLDLFAGSGALSLEALSRGAEEAVMLENHPAAAAQLRQNLALLKSDKGKLITEDSLAWLSRAAPESKGFDVVFVDPPFQQNLWQRALDALHQNHWLAPGAAIYIESGRDIPYQTPQSWNLHRDKQAGQVCYRLYLVTDPSAD